jgi:predicted AAA+ superfamily ATPase
MYTDRKNKEVIESSFKRPFITAILGPRRVGKSLFVKHYAEKNPELKWVFLNMDDMIQRSRVENQELKDLIVEGSKQGIGEGNKIWVVIDEAQKCPLVFDQVKILYDAYKDQNTIKFILTGSAVLSLHQLSAESLAGRIELLHLQEFTLLEGTLHANPEILKLSVLDQIGKGDPYAIEAIIHKLKPFKPELEAELHEQLIWGGLPEIKNCRDDNEKIIYLNNYIQTYLEKDVRAIETINNLPLYRNLMSIIAEQTGSIRNEKSIVDALGCTRDTLKKYRGFLEATLLYQDLYPFIGNALNRIIKSPKGYLRNNGLISVLTGLYQSKALTSSGKIGHRFENWFLNELSVWLARDPMRSEIYFWRRESGNEVDFIVEKKPYIYPFEVTYGNSPEIKKLRNLTKFLSEEPKADWGYYLYRGDFAIDEKSKICFIPAWAIG